MLKSYPEYHRVLLRYPHIARKISLFWGEPELDFFLNDLFMDSRDGEREGLPLDVADDIMSLWKKHSEIVPGQK